LFPDVLEIAGPFIVTIGAMNLVMGAVCAVPQKNLNRLLAYLCLSQFGLALMGVGSLSSMGLVGAFYQQLVLGLSWVGFGLIVGILVQRTGQASFLTDTGERIYGGIAVQAPIVAVITGVILASLLGFPGFGGFVSYALVLMGSYTMSPITVLIAGGAFLLISYGLLSVYRSLFFGEYHGSSKTFLDLTFWERAYLLPVVSLLIMFGLFPKPWIQLVRLSILMVLNTVK
jgi:NADH-quinone oxidoreductase subunit M